MSLIALAWKHYTHYPLLLLANRDEFYERPSEPLQRWDGPPAFYAGKDLREGGTWLAIGETGRFAVVTDFHRHLDPDPVPEHSRGQLVLDFMRSQEDPESWLIASSERRANCLPHNLLVSDGQTLFYACSVSHAIEELSPGLHSLGDSYLDSHMPKCRYVQDKLAQRLQDQILTDAERDELFEVLRYPMRFPKEDLPMRGYPVDVERELSPVFLELDAFGTLASTIISVDDQGQVILAEQGYDHDAAGKAHPQGQIRLLDFRLQV